MSADEAPFDCKCMQMQADAQAPPYSMLKHRAVAWTFKAGVKGLLCHRRCHMGALLMGLDLMGNNLGHQMCQCWTLEVMAWAE